MSGQAPELGDQRREQSVSQLVVRVEQLHEDWSGQRQRLGRLDGGCRCRPRLTVEEGELPKEVGGMQRRDDGLVPLRGGKHDLHRARGDDVQRIARVALVEDHLVAPKSADTQMIGHRFEHAALASKEERALAQAVDREPIIGHRCGTPPEAPWALDRDLAARCAAV